MFEMFEEFPHESTFQGNNLRMLNNKTIHFNKNLPNQELFKLEKTLQTFQTLQTTNPTDARL